MGVSSPDPRYFKDGSGLRPRWRFFFRWPKQYLWMRSPRWFKDARFAVQRWRRRNEPRAAFSAALTNTSENLVAGVGEARPAEHEHEWVDARNEAIKSGEWCPKCGAVREALVGAPATERPDAREPS